MARRSRVIHRAENRGVWIASRSVFEGEDFGKKLRPELEARQQHLRDEAGRAEVTGSVATG
jgi:hypothetical protein